MAQSDWQVLADPNVPIAVRLGALGRLCKTCDDPVLDVFCCLFIDEVVRTGGLQKAFEQACKWAKKNHGKPVTPPQCPDTGRIAARGPSGLTVMPGEVRAAITPILAALSRRSAQNPQLALWLFEAAKLWASERHKALGELTTARVDDAVLTAGVDSVVDFAAARPEPGGEIVRAVASAWRQNLRWLVLLLTSLSARKKAADATADELRGDDLSPLSPLLADPLFLRPQLVRLASTAPSGARALALQALANLNASVDDVVPILAALLADRSLHPRVTEAAARLCRQRRVFAQDVVTAAQSRLAEGFAAVHNERNRQAVREALQALTASARVGQPKAPVLLRSERLLVYAGDLGVSNLAVVADVGIAVTQQPLSIVPESEWRTGEDAVGVIAVRSDSAIRVTAPVRFPEQTTGGVGARRKVELAGVQHGLVVMVACTPVSDVHGWGNVNYGLGWDPLTAQWCTYKNDHGKLRIDRPLTAPVEESELPRLCFGEAIVWLTAAGLRLVQDGTPYHLDDWEFTSEVRTALEARRTQLLPWRVYTGKSPWTLVAEDGGIVHLADVEQELRSLWPYYRTAVHTDLVQAVGSGDWLLLALRAFGSTDAADSCEALIRVRLDARALSRSRAMAH